MKDVMSDSTQTKRLPAASGPIRVSIPVSVAYDLDKLTTVLGNIAKAGGHEFCTSGRDFLFEQISEFVVDPATLEPVAAGA
jgi:hypothetical protein